MLSEKPTARFLLGILVPCFALSSCYLFKSKEKKRSAHFLIDEFSVSLTRTETRESAQLSFRTFEPALCRLAFWSLEVDHTKEEPTIQPCATATGATEFVEAIRGLNQQTLYRVEISAWKIDTNIEASDRLQVEENGGRGVGRELIVMRFNLPVQVAEVHRFNAGGPISLRSLRENPPVGCFKQSTPQSNPYSSATNPDFNKIETTGYASSSSVKNPNNGSYFRLFYNTLNPLERLTVSVQGAQNYNFVTKQPPEFYDLQIESKEKITLRYNGVARSNQLIEFSDRLSVTWAMSQQVESSSVQIQVGQPNQTGAFYCNFEPRNGRAEIPSEFLSQIKAGESYDLTASLLANQLQIFPNLNQKTWLISSSDWRSARIKRI